MVHGSLFSGIGGFDLAAEWMGWENAFHCEINPFCQHILKHYWPNATTYTDIRETDFTSWQGKQTLQAGRGNVDILTGGFPCQPFSTAGKREGTADPRHLWPEYLRAIREIRPRWVVGENVRGLLSWSEGLVFDTVCADLEAEGYEVFPVVLPAAGVNAPHRRDRIWFIAYNPNAGFENMRRTREDAFYAPQSFTDSNGVGWRRESNGIGETRQFDKTRQKYDWQNFSTVSPVCSGNDGISDRLDAAAIFNGKRGKRGNPFTKWRTESIKAAGNAIVPQVAYQIFDAIDTYEFIYA